MNRKPEQHEQIAVLDCVYSALLLIQTVIFNMFMYIFPMCDIGTEIAVYAFKRALVTMNNCFPLPQNNGGQHWH